MLNAAKPIFEFLYAFLNENFSERDVKETEKVFNVSEDDRVKIFDKIDRGASLPTPALGRKPQAWLEFGQVTDILPDRSPEGYSYQLYYDMPVFWRTGQSTGVRETYRENDHSPFGIGDIISEVIPKVWDQLHVGILSRGNWEIQMGRFVDNAKQRGQLSVSDTNWWVKEWTCNVNGEVVDTTSEWRDVFHNAPDIGMKVIVFKFTVFEQKVLC